MKCAKAKKWISHDIDDGLNSAQKRVLEAHLQACPECQKLRENFKKITAAAQKLEEFSPRGETWFKIASQMKAKQNGTVQPVRKGLKGFFPSPRVLVWTASAALLFVVVAGTFFFGPKIWKQDPGSQKYVLSKLGNAERHYQKAIEALWQAVSSQKEDIDPQLYAVFQKNLDIIDQSIIACKEAVLSRPDSLDSRNFLLAAYKEKRNLLEEMMTASASPVEQRDVGSIY
jgi:tetratricopeptide (TPR) repeat protein